MYEPESIYEINENNENKNYILAGYDKISEEKGSQSSKYESEFNEESSSRRSKENNTSLDLIEETNSSISKNKNNINIKNNPKMKKPQQSIHSNQKIKNTFFDDAYKNSIIKNNKVNNNIQNNKNKSKTKKKNPPNYNNQIRNNTINYKEPIKQEQKTEISDSNTLVQNNIIETEELNETIKEKNEDNNNINTLSSNSLKENKSTGTGRNNNDYSFKNNIARHKKSYRDSLAQNNMQKREINLRFILTKEEYAVLMKEKAKNQDILIN